MNPWNILGWMIVVAFGVALILVPVALVLISRARGRAIARIERAREAVAEPIRKAR